MSDDDDPRGPRDDDPSGPRDDDPSGPRDDGLRGPRDDDPRGPHDNDLRGARGHRPPRSMAEQIADSCGRMIVDGRFAAGERITETQLAGIFDVSRGPVREAIRILEKRRLVEVQPRRGVYVCELSLASAKELFDVRNALSGMSARLMAGAPGSPWFDTLVRRIEELEAAAQDPGADPVAFSWIMTRIVRTIVRGGGSQLAEHMFGELTESTFWTAIWNHPLDARTQRVRRLRARQLRATLTALQSGDGDVAERLLRECLEDTRDMALATLLAERPAAVTR
jgi:DNA-binding GntR family transcriptional regulator